MATAKKLNLALQGGGSHGAYTWGVLDRLLEEPRLKMEGISGTSAGAMNGAVMISGLMEGGAQAAQRGLREFWEAISELNFFNPLQQSAPDRMSGGWNLDWSPGYHFFDMLSRVYSPYELNPLNINPLRVALKQFVCEKALQSCTSTRLFVTATHVESGQPRVFRGKEVTIDALLASACLPFIFQAVEIGGEHFWDGGYMGNPAIWPLLYYCGGEDVMLVQINPIHREGVPDNAHEIINRLNEITFNSSLIAEMRAIQFVKKLHAQKLLDRNRYKDVRMHLVYSPEQLKPLNASSKMNAHMEFFEYLHDLGHRAADEWLKRHWGDLGIRATVDIREKFLGGPTRPTRKQPAAKPRSKAPARTRTKKT